MHELSYLLRFLSLAEETLKKEADENPEKALQPASVTLEVGELTGILPEYLHRYYPAAVKNTAFREASLEIIYLPAKLRCLSCGLEYHPEKAFDYRCPGCGSLSGKILQGRELALKEIRLKLP